MIDFHFPLEMQFNVVIYPHIYFLTTHNLRFSDPKILIPLRQAGCKYYNSDAGTL